MNDVVFYSSISGGGKLVGETDKSRIAVDVTNDKSVLLPVSIKDLQLIGNIEVLSRRYNANNVISDYLVELSGVSANTISKIKTNVYHPDDSSGVMFFTNKSYEETRHNLMFQDDEHVSVYTDRRIRAFKVNEPLQVRYDAIKDSFAVRFFLPKPLKNVIVKVKIPSISNEFIDFAYFDSIPGLAEMFCQSPMTTKKAFYITESGRKIELGPVSREYMSKAQFKIDSDTEYWRKLKTIKHNWEIGFHTYGTDPETGNIINNWRSPRPVHCREYLIAFINMAYMFNMPEYWDMMEANKDLFWDDNKQKIEIEELKRRHFRGYAFHLAVAKYVLGQGDTISDTFTRYAVAQEVLGYYYPNDPHTLFHEFGHVMGYLHDSSMSYGQWAEKLCHDFYLQNFKDFPIESRSYNDFSTNQNLYKD